MRVVVVLVVVGLLALALAGVARAHFAPDPETNNRYVKVTLTGGEVRVVYVVYYGERPGAALRREMDRDGDGVIAPAEARAFGAGVRAAVAPAVSLVVDGDPVPAERWQVTDVGLGGGAGAFSVDLEVTFPYPDPQRATHTVALDDEAQLDRAGEAELDVIESPGVRVISPAETYFTWKGNPAAGNHAVHVDFSVDPAIRPRPSAAPRWPLILGVFGALVVVGGGVAWLTRRR